MKISITISIPIVHDSSVFFYKNKPNFTKFVTFNVQAWNARFNEEDEEELDINKPLFDVHTFTAKQVTITTH